MTDNLARWGWHQSMNPDDSFQNFLTEDEEIDGLEWPGLGLDPPLEEFGLHTESGNDPSSNIHVVFVQHSDPTAGPLDGQTYTVDSKTYRATGANFKFGIETSTGAMFSLILYSPTVAAASLKTPISKDNLPDLQRASDIAWLFWARHAATKNKLKYFFNVSITNSNTQQAIRRALKNTNQAYGPWPGATFDTASDEGKVLLGKT